MMKGKTMFGLQTVKKGKKKKVKMGNVALGFDGGAGEGKGEDVTQKTLFTASKSVLKKVEKEHKDAMEQDPSVFDYDGVYEDMQSASGKSERLMERRKEEKGGEKKQARYIQNLKRQAKLKDVENDRAYERKLNREREEEEKMFGKSEMKFVTASYKRKLEEQKRWEAEEELEDKLEEKHAAVNQGMGGFYRNLLTKNIAMGGDVDTSARSAFTAGSKMNKFFTGEKETEETEENNNQELEPRTGETEESVETAPTVKKTFNVVATPKTKKVSKEVVESTAVVTNISKTDVESARERFLKRRKMQENQTKT